MKIMAMVVFTISLAAIASLVLLAQDTRPTLKRKPSTQSELSGNLFPSKIQGIFAANQYGKDKGQYFLNDQGRLLDTSYYGHYGLASYKGQSQSSDFPIFQYDAGEQATFSASDGLLKLPCFACPTDPLIKRIQKEEEHVYGRYSSGNQAALELRSDMKFSWLFNKRSTSGDYEVFGDYVVIKLTEAFTLGCPDGSCNPISSNTIVFNQGQNLELFCVFGPREAQRLILRKSSTPNQQFAANQEDRYATEKVRSKFNVESFRGHIVSYLLKQEFRNPKITFYNTDFKDDGVTATTVIVFSFDKCRSIKRVRGAIMDCSERGILRGYAVYEYRQEIWEFSKVGGISK